MIREKRQYVIDIQQNLYRKTVEREILIEDKETATEISRLASLRGISAEEVVKQAIDAIRAQEMLAALENLER